jgi:TM2 domain-containing membrane protein YozV
MRILSKSFLCLLTFVYMPLFGKDWVLELADEFFESDFYEEAITEYERYIFFNDSGREVSYAYYKIGLANRNMRNLERSSDAFELSAHVAFSDTTKDERKIDIAVNYIAGGEYSKAKFLLLKLISFSKIPDIRKKASLFLGISHLYCYEWESAKDALEVYFRCEKNRKAAHMVGSLLLEAENIKYKSPTTAKWLSTFIPGTGQMYDGNAGSGINALVLNGANIYFIIYKLLKEEYGNAYLIYFFLFRRYYMGNIYNAKKEAREYNRRMNEQTAEKIFDLLKVVSRGYVQNENRPPPF